MSIAISTSHARLQGAGLILAATLCWSLGGLLVRMVSADGWTIVFWRSVFMLLAIGGYLLVRHGGRTLAVIHAIGWAGLLSGMMLTGAFVFFVLSVIRTEVANTVLLMSAAPLFAAILGRIILGEALAPRTLVTIGVAFGGICLMFVDAVGVGDLLGNLFALAVALCFAGNIVLVRSRRQVDMVPTMLVAGLLAALLALVLGEPWQVRGGDLVWLAMMGFVQLGLGLFLFLRGAPHLTAAEVGLLTLGETILAPIWVWLALGEAPKPLALAGGLVVLGALVAHSALGLRRSKPPIGMA